MKKKKIGSFGFSGIFLEKLKKIKRILSSNNLCPVRDSKVALPEYKSEVLLLEPAFSSLYSKLQ